MRYFFYYMDRIQGHIQGNIRFWICLSLALTALKYSGNGCTMDNFFVFVFFTLRKIFLWPRKDKPDPDWLSPVLDTWNQLWAIRTKVFNGLEFLWLAMIQIAATACYFRVKLRKQVGNPIFLCHVLPYFEWTWQCFYFL